MEEKAVPDENEGKRIIKITELKISKSQKIHQSN